MINIGWGNEKGKIEADSQVSTIYLMVVLPQLEATEGTGLRGKCFQCVHDEGVIQMRQLDVGVHV